MKKSVLSILLAAMLCVSAFVFAACDNGTTSGTGDENDVSYTVTVDGGKGSGVYPSGAPCTAIADVPDGYIFEGWYSGDALVSSQRSYKFKVEKDITLKAVIHSEYVNVSVTDGATVNSTIGTARVKVGDEVVVAAPSNQNRQFKHFVINGNPAAIVTDNPYRFTAADDISLQAVYEGKVCLVSVVNGAITGSESDKFGVGDECTVTADEPSTGMFFTGWAIYDSLGNQVTVSTESVYTFEVTDTVAIYALYAYKNMLTVNNGTVAGTTDSIGYYFENDKVSLIANADSTDSYFSHWEFEGRFLSKSREYELSMGATNMTIDAVFVNKRLATPSSNEIYHWTGAVCEFLRYKPQDTADIFNTPGIDYILWYIYDDVDAEKDDYIGVFKFYSQINGGTDKITTMDGTIEGTYIGGNNNDRCNWGGLGLEEFDQIVEYSIGESFDPSKSYYFAIQLIGKYDSGFADSEISGIDTDSYRGR